MKNGQAGILFLGLCRPTYVLFDLCLRVQSVFSQLSWRASLLHISTTRTRSRSRQPFPLELHQKRPFSVHLVGRRGTSL